jgi:hypothetical protein
MVKIQQSLDAVGITSEHLPVYLPEGSSSKNDPTTVMGTVGKV